MSGSKKKHTNTIDSIKYLLESSFPCLDSTGSESLPSMMSVLESRFLQTQNRLEFQKILKSNNLSNKIYSSYVYFLSDPQNLFKDLYSFLAYHQPQCVKYELGCVIIIINEQTREIFHMSEEVVGEESIFASDEKLKDEVYSFLVVFHAKYLSATSGSVSWRLFQKDKISPDDDFQELIKTGRGIPYYLKRSDIPRQIHDFLFNPNEKVLSFGKSDIDYDSLKDLLSKIDENQQQQKEELQKHFFLETIFCFMGRVFSKWPLISRLCNMELFFPDKEVMQITLESLNKNDLSKTKRREITVNKSYLKYLEAAHYSNKDGKIDLEPDKDLMTEASSIKEQEYGKIDPEPGKDLMAEASSIKGQEYDQEKNFTGEEESSLEEAAVQTSEVYLGKAKEKEKEKDGDEDEDEDGEGADFHPKKKLKRLKKLKKTTKRDSYQNNDKNLAVTYSRKRKSELEEEEPEEQIEQIFKKYLHGDHEEVHLKKLCYFTNKACDLIKHKQTTPSILEKYFNRSQAGELSRLLFEAQKSLKTKES